MGDQEQVVSDSDSGAAGDFEDFVLDVAIERDIGEGGGVLRGRQAAGVKRPLAILVAQDELSPLMGCGVHDHKGPKHICAPGSVLVRFKE